jgi:hypothetical protein
LVKREDGGFRGTHGTIRKNVGSLDIVFVMEFKNVNTLGFVDILVKLQTLYVSPMGFVPYLGYSLTSVPSKGFVFDTAKIDG